MKIEKKLLLWKIAAIVLLLLFIWQAYRIIVLQTAYEEWMATANNCIDSTVDCVYHDSETLENLKACLIPDWDEINQAISK